MNKDINKINDITIQEEIDPILKAFHVGGRGGFGPTEALIPMNKDLSITLFEASIENMSEYDEFATGYKNTYGVSISVIECCLSNSTEKRQFYINEVPESSSLLKIDPDAKNWIHGAFGLKWGQMCIPKNSIEVEVTTIDDLYFNKKIQIPDFLSLDAQGSEYEILEGSSIALNGNLVGVVTEVEFSQIYEGQKLFADQDNLLRQHKFNLFDMYNIEYWYPGPKIGTGNLTVAEALFLRDYRYFINKDKTPYILLNNLSKLAMVAFCFNKTSYTVKIMDYINNNLQNEWDVYVKSYNNRYLHSLNEFYNEQLKINQI